MDLDISQPGAQHIDWFKVLQENFAHARHAEVLRERGNNLYWLMWGAALAFLSSGKGTVPGGSAAVFGALAVMSGAVLVSGLKWNIEFANHIAAIASIAEGLGLNSVVEAPRSRKSYLPYSEFRGFMALPLLVPIWLNVGLIMSGLHCVGLAGAIWLFISGLGGHTLMVLVGAVASLLLSGLLCIWAFRVMRRQTALRTGPSEVVRQARGASSKAGASVATG